MRSRLLPVVATTLLGLLLAGCAQVPTSGGVREGGPVRADNLARYVGIFAVEPQPGDTETQVVEGYISAMASYVPGYPTARLYLSPDARAAWRPDDGIAVYDSSRGYSVQKLAQGVVRLTVPQVATISPSGAYQRAAPGTLLDLKLRLHRVGKEWRIATPPDGVLMSEFDVQRELARYDVYFPDRDGQVLVPEPVYLPVNAALPTLLVEALLRGPSEGMAAALGSGFPEAARLSGTGVSVGSGTARVPLVTGGANLSVAERDVMSAQLVWTLGQIAGVTGVQLVLDGDPVVVGGSSASGVQPTTAWRRFDPAVVAPLGSTYAVDGDGAVVEVGPGAAGPVSGALGTAASPARSVAVDLGRVRFATVSRDGTALRVAPADGASPPAVVLRGTDLSAPSFDRTGLLWVVDRTAAGSQVRVVTPDGTVVGVPTPPLPGARVERLRVARDGVRVVLLTRRGQATQVLVGVVVREAPGAERPAPRITSLAQVRTAGPILDVEWAEPTLLALLRGGPDADSHQPALVDLSGADLEPRGFVPGAVSLAAAPGEPLVAATGAGRLYRLDAAQQWVPAGTGASPVYPG